jgi:HPt (histidine-containing phosphotransfer) domain-containing protein
MNQLNKNSVLMTPESAWLTLESQTGVDFSLALDLLDNDRAMLAQLLAEFTLDFGGLMDETNEALAKGDHETLIRRMHALKGAAATLGLQALSSEASAMEMALKQQEATTAPLEALRQSFSALLPLLQAASQQE